MRRKQENFHFQKRRKQFLTMSDAVIRNAFDYCFKGDASKLADWVKEHAPAKVGSLHPDRNTTLLYTAARFGHFECARILLEDGFADVNQPNGGDDGSIPLHGACYGGNPEIVALLMQYGAFTEAPNKHKETPEDNANAPASGTHAAKAKKCAALLKDPKAAGALLSSTIGSGPKSKRAKAE